MALRPAANYNKEYKQFIELGTHSFIIKVWLDEPKERTTQVEWHGQVTHVATGERCNFQRVSEVLAFLQLYLNELQIKLPFYWRIYLWIRGHWRYRPYITGRSRL